MEYKGLIDKTILVKFTTRQRPERALACLSMAKSLAHNTSKIKWLLTLDTDDETAISFSKRAIDLIPEAQGYFGASLSKIHANNRDVDMFSTFNDWDILLNLSDDQTCCLAGWDSLIRESMPNDLDASLWFYDGAQPRINTQEIVGYNYYKRTGYIYNPIYKSFYCDNESTEVANMLGKLIKNPNTIFRHDHPACHHTTSIGHDSLYERNQSAWDHDKELFNQRRAINFGL